MVEMRIYTNLSAIQTVNIFRERNRGYHMQAVQKLNTALPSGGKGIQRIYAKDIDVCVCVCVIHHGRLLLVTQPAYGASSELINRSSGRAETTSHTTHWDSEATTPRVTSLTYLLQSEQGLDTH